MSVVDRRPPMHGGYHYRGEYWTIHPKSWSKNIQASLGLPGSTYGWNVGNNRNPLRYHSGSVQEHADAILYYGTFGLLDPKMPFEAYGYKKAMGAVGLRGFLLGAGISMTGGFLLGATVGWIMDPMDKRKGGVMQSQTWKKYKDVPSKFAVGDWSFLKGGS